MDIFGHATKLTGIYGLTPSWSVDFSAMALFTINGSMQSFQCNPAWGTGTNSDCVGGYSNFEMVRLLDGSIAAKILYPKGYGLIVDVPIPGTSDPNWGGASFRERFPNPAPSMLLEYSVYIPPDFQFQEEGRLPGLSAGYSQGCLNNRADGRCWSLAPKWTAGGKGLLYAYLPSGNQALCTENRCSRINTGVYIGEGDFIFKPGQWHNIAIFVQLNDRPGHANGQIHVWVNSKQPVIIQRGILFTIANQSDPILPSHLIFQTYYSNVSVAPTDTYLVFRNFSMSSGDRYSSLSASNSALASKSPFEHINHFLLIFAFLAAWYVSMR